MMQCASSNNSKKRKADAEASESDTAASSMSVDRNTGRGMMGMPSAEDAAENAAVDAAEAASASSAARSGKAPSMPRVRVGNRHLTMHEELVEMTDSTALFTANDYTALRARLEDQGFLFVRGVIPPATVRAARMKMLVHLRDKGAMRDNTEWEQGFIEYQSKWDEKQKIIKGTAAQKKKQKNAAAAAATTAATPKASMGMMSAAASSSSAPSNKKMIPGWVVDAESGGLVGGRESDDAIKGWHAIGNSRELKDVYNGASIRAFYQRLFENDEDYTSRPHLASQGALPYTTLPSCTWLRAKGPGEVTAEHADYYYFAKNTSIFGDYFTPTAEDAKQQAEKQKGKKEMTEDEKEVRK